MTPPLFGSWLSETLELQTRSYGHDPSRVDPHDELELESWLTYVREQTLAAFVELGEFIQNLRWKPWAKTKQLPTLTERAAAVEELVDVLHFIGNDLAALGVTDAELTRVYERKMQVNRERMARGGH